MSESSRAVLVAVLVCAGAFVALSCLYALNFEVSGFGRPADTPLRVPYVVSLVAGAVAGVGVPAVAALMLLGPSVRWAVGLVGAVALAGLLTFLGLKLF